MCIQVSPYFILTILFLCKFGREFFSLFRKSLESRSFFLSFISQENLQSFVVYFGMLFPPYLSLFSFISQENLQSFLFILECFFSQTFFFLFIRIIMLKLFLSMLSAKLLFITGQFDLV